MKLSKRIIVDYVPGLASAALWAYYIFTREALIAAILVSIYTVVLYLSTEKQKFAGVIEVAVNEEGAKTFQLIVDKDPQTFQDRDEVIFLFKEVS